MSRGIISQTKPLCQRRRSGRCYHCPMSDQEPFPRVLGPVTLVVKDLQRCLEFLSRWAGDGRLLTTNGEQATLGAGQAEMLVLEENRTAPRVGRHHRPLSFSRSFCRRARTLRGKLRRMLESGVQLHGAADHDVSEALYLADPEGNGVEIYRDRPRQQWVYDHGQIRMGSSELDVQGLLAKGRRFCQSNAARHDHRPRSPARLGLAGGGSIFIENVLGFDVTTRLWKSSDVFPFRKFGYHHHLGLNTWGSLGAPPPPEGAAGLKTFCNLREGCAGAVARRIGGREGGGLARGRARRRIADCANPSGNRPASIATADS